MKEPRKKKMKEDFSVLFSTELHPLELLTGFLLPKVSPFEEEPEEEEDNQEEQPGWGIPGEYPGEEIDDRNQDENDGEDVGDGENEEEESRIVIKTPQRNPILLNPTLTDINKGQVIENIILEKSTKIERQIYPRGSVVRIIKYGEV